MIFFSTFTAKSYTRFCAAKYVYEIIQTTTRSAVYSLSNQQKATQTNSKIILPQILPKKQKVPIQTPSKVWYIGHRTKQVFQYRMDSYTSMLQPPP